MAEVPVPPSFSPGVSSTSQLSQLADSVTFLQNPPRAELRQGSAQSIPNNTSTGVTFNIQDLDENVAGTAQHDTVTNSSRFTAVYPGWYQCSGAVCFAANATGVRITQWAVNGTVQNGTDSEISAVSGAVTIVVARTRKLYLDVGDYVELRAFQNSGGALNTGVTTSNQSGMSQLWASN